MLTPTSGSDKETILKAIDKLKAAGSTSGESALRMAYEEAQKAFVPNGINRILLATDGDFNVGVSDTETLKSMVAEKRKTGISLSTLGFGTDNYNEDMMEQIADAGDGNYSYIDNEKEAKKSFTAATDFHACHHCARCQNPSRIQSCHCQRIPLGRLH